MNAASRALAQTSLGIKNVWEVFLLPQQFHIVLLSLVVFVSSLGVVYMKDLNRRLYRDVQIQQEQHQMLQTEWGQLLLEQSTWARQTRIEKVATQQLQMIVPQPQKIVMVED